MEFLGEGGTTYGDGRGGLSIRLTEHCVPVLLPHPHTPYHMLHFIEKMSEQTTRYIDDTSDVNLAGTNNTLHQCDNSNPIVLKYHANIGILTCICGTVIGNSRHTCMQSPVVVSPCSNSLSSSIRRPCITCSKRWDASTPLAIPS